jgi:2-dehydro-3-deoxyphosphogluconate aldolase/(4S)-4-hydroxy-2-oxoglutarate aldolase
VTEPHALGVLRERRLIAVIRAATPEAALGAAHAVADGGIAMIEVTFTVPDAPRVMRELSHRNDLVVGAGTVLAAGQCQDAIAAGATFVIAPNFSPEVAEVAIGGGALYVPGAYTTSEILAARAGGGHVIKVYPVGAAGGPAYIQVIRDPLPDVPMLAAGGTNLENALAFLRAGCIGVGLGAALADPKLAAKGEFAEITRRARAFVSRLAQYDRAGAQRS